MTKAIDIVEVGPRDGLQNEKLVLSVSDRAQFIRKLIDAGLSRLEAGAFVRADKIPAMADTDKVLAKLSDCTDTELSVLVPNAKGLQAALDAEAKTLAVFTAVSETFTQKNIGCTIAESLARFVPIFEAAKDQGLRVRGYISCVCGCPYEGKVDSKKTTELTQKLLEAGAFEISLGDTIGVGTPDQVGALAKELVGTFGAKPLAFHLHNTNGKALENVWAAFDQGIGVFDSSAGGLGGCPYAGPGAAGNLATEDLVESAEDKGISTGVDLSRLAKASLFVENLLGKKLPSEALERQR